MRLLICGLKCPLLFISLLLTMRAYFRGCSDSQDLITYYLYNVHRCLSPFGLLQQNTRDWLINTEIYFSQLAGKSKIKVPADSVFGENLFPGSQTSHFFAVSSHGRRGNESLWGLFCKGTSAIHKGSILMTQSPLKDPTSKYSHWGLISKYEFWRDTNVWSIEI